MSDMELLSRPVLDEISQCPYLVHMDKRYEYFFARNLNEEEISSILAKGWRKFGIHFFRPSCPNCIDCIPLRVLVPHFSPSKSQRRVLKRCENVEIRFVEPKFTERVYEIFESHSKERFSLETDLEDFAVSFYTPSCPGLQSEYFIDGEMAGVGFIDIGKDCLSSVYFAFDPKFSDYGLGTFSILKEIEHANSMGLAYYYLGYYVPGCSRMAYKDRFLPREYYRWEEDVWLMSGS